MKPMVSFLAGSVMMLHPDDTSQILEVVQKAREKLASYNETAVRIRQQLDG